MRKHSPYTKDENDIVETLAIRKNYDQKSLSRPELTNLTRDLFLVSQINRKPSTINAKYLYICQQHNDPNYRQNLKLKNKPEAIQKTKPQINIGMAQIYFETLLETLKKSQKENQNLRLENKSLKRDLEDCKSLLRGLKKIREAVDECRAKKLC